MPGEGRPSGRTHKKSRGLWQREDLRARPAAFMNTCVQKNGSRSRGQAYTPPNWKIIPMTADAAMKTTG